MAGLPRGQPSIPTPPTADGGTTYGRPARATDFSPAGGCPQRHSQTSALRASLRALRRPARPTERNPGAGSVRTPQIPCIAYGNLASPTAARTCYGTQSLPGAVGRRKSPTSPACPTAPGPPYGTQSRGLDRSGRHKFPTLPTPHWHCLQRPARATERNSSPPVGRHK